MLKITNFICAVNLGERLQQLVRLLAKFHLMALLYLPALANTPQYQKHNNCSAVFGSPDPEKNLVGDRRFENDSEPRKSWYSLLENFNGRSPISLPLNNGLTLQITPDTHWVLAYKVGAAESVEGMGTGVNLAIRANSISVGSRGQVELKRIATEVLRQYLTEGTDLRIALKPYYAESGSIAIYSEDVPARHLFRDPRIKLFMDRLLPELESISPSPPNRWADSQWDEFLNGMRETATIKRDDYFPPENFSIDYYNPQQRTFQTVVKLIMEGPVPSARVKQVMALLQTVIKGWQREVFQERFLSMQFDGNNYSNWHWLVLIDVLRSNLKPWLFEELLKNEMRNELRNPPAIFASEIDDSANPNSINLMYKDYRAVLLLERNPNWRLTIKQRLLKFFGRLR